MTRENDPAYSDAGMPTGAERGDYNVGESTVDPDTGDFESSVVEDSHTGHEHEFVPGAPPRDVPDDDHDQLGMTAKEQEQERLDKIDDAKWASGENDHLLDADDESQGDPDDPEPPNVPEIEHLTEAELEADYKLRTTSRRKLHRQRIDSQDGSSDLVGEQRAASRWRSEGFGDQSDMVSAFQDTDPLDDDPLSPEDRHAEAVDTATEFYDAAEAEADAQRRDLERGMPRPGSKGEAAMFKAERETRARAIRNVANHPFFTSSDE